MLFKFITISYYHTQYKNARAIGNKVRPCTRTFTEM